MPDRVLQAVSSRQGVELKTHDQTVLLAPLTEPSDLVVLAGEYAYVFQLKPDPDRGPETILIEDARGKAARAMVDTAGSEDEDPLTSIYALIRAGLTGRWPTDAMVEPLPRAEWPRWLELEIVDAEHAWVRRGARWFETQRLRLKNAAERPLSLRETEWYTGTELAIALDRQVVEPGHTMVVSLVRPSEPPQWIEANQETPNPDPESAAPPDAADRSRGR